MYALIHKNNVISGPIGWDRAFFTFILNRKNIPIEKPIPRAPVAENIYNINSDTKIMRVETLQDGLNPLVEYYEGPRWEILDDIVKASYIVKDVPIEFARNNIKELVANIRYNKEIKGTKATVQETEITIDTSRDGRNIFVQKYSLMGDSETVNWKFPEGWLTITRAELGSIIAAGGTYIQTCFDWEKNYSDAIDAATTKEQLIKIEQDIKDEENN